MLWVDECPVVGSKLYYHETPDERKLLLTVVETNPLRVRMEAISPGEYASAKGSWKPKSEMTLYFERHKNIKLYFKDINDFGRTQVFDWAYTSHLYYEGYLEEKFHFKHIYTTDQHDVRSMHVQKAKSL